MLNSCLFFFHAKKDTLRADGEEKEFSLVKIHPFSVSQQQRIEKTELRKMIYHFDTLPLPRPDISIEFNFLSTPRQQKKEKNCYHWRSERDSLRTNPLLLSICELSKEPKSKLSLYYANEASDVAEIALSLSSRVRRVPFHSTQKDTQHFLFFFSQSKALVNFSTLQHFIIARPYDALTWCRTFS